MHACTQLTGGDVYCWGNNRNYQVGGAVLGTTTNVVTEPTKVLNLPIGENFTLNVLGQSSCVVGNTTGALYCWGDTSYAGHTEDFDLRSRATQVSF